MRDPEDPIAVGVMWSLFATAPALWLLESAGVGPVVAVVVGYAAVPLVVSCLYILGLVGIAAVSTGVIDPTRATAMRREMFGEDDDER